MNKYHFIPPYLRNPYDPITVALIGCGGTGSQVLQGLARINIALKALGHMGITVTAYDYDTVTKANIGRQLFSREDVGMNKAIALIQRTNRFFGFTWNAKNLLERNDCFNIYITCVDSVKSRKEVIETINYSKSEFKAPDRSHRYYWIDFGNSKDHGQVIMKTLDGLIIPSKFTFADGTKAFNQKTLPGFFDLFPKVKDKKDDGPSCSLAEALTQQDLFINSSLAQLGCNLLWKLFREEYIEYHGFFLNLKSYACQPINMNRYKKKEKNESNRNKSMGRRKQSVL